MRMARCVLGIASLGACGNASDDAAWSVVAESQPASLLSVWGSSATDVWVVGGDPRDGTGPIVQHYDGETWTKLDTGERNVDLWWVTGFAGGPVLMSGSNGTILRYQDGAFEKLPTPGNLIVFGMWGAAPDDLWAVGGNSGGGGFAWRYDGNAWRVVPEVPPDITSQGTCWKVSGRDGDDVWISGSNGTTLHWNGATLDRIDVPIEAPLLSVAGNAERFITVGGAFDGVLYENEGSGWRAAIPPGGPRLAGIAVSTDLAYAVGEFGVVLRRGSSGWSTDQSQVTAENLHAAWIDPAGGVWAVGGDYDVQPTKMGVLLHKGELLRGAFP
jgi:hypothetical protein